MSTVSTVSTFPPVTVCFTAANQRRDTAVFMSDRKNTRAAGTGLTGRVEKRQLLHSCSNKSITDHPRSKRS